MTTILYDKKKRYIWIAVLVTVMGIFRGIEKPNGYIFDIEFILNFILNATLLLAWIISVYIRIIHKKIRGYLMSIGILMFFWLLVRTVKYRVLSVFFNMNMLWYLFYIPIVLIPLLSYFTARTVGREKDWRLPFKDKMLIVPATVIIAGVLTNDIHRMAFVFEGSAYVGMTYGYGLFYYLAYAFSFYCVLACISIMFRKSRIKESKEKIYLPFIIVSVYILYSVFYNLNQNHKFLQFIEITIAYCMTTIAFWESCIQIGLISSNSNYNKFFKNSTMNTWIVDDNGTVRYYTGEKNRIDPDTFEQLKRDATVFEHIGSRLYMNPITGGYVIREEHSDAILRLIDELEEVNSKIENDITLIQNQMNIDEKRIKFKEKNRLYDIINKHTYVQMNKIKENLDYISKNGNNQDKWREVNICATYIKRYSNLVFLSEYNDKISLEDVGITIEESLNNLSKMGICAGFKLDSCGEIDKDRVFVLYNALQRIIEMFFRHLRDIFIVIRSSGEDLSMSVLLNGEGLREQFNGEEFIESTVRGPACCDIYEEDSDNIQINMRFCKE